MSITSEEQRQRDIKKTERELGRVDAERIAEEERQLDDLSKISPKAQQLEEEKRNREARAEQEVISEVDASERTRMDEGFIRTADLLGLDRISAEDNMDIVVYVYDWAKEASGKADPLDVIGYMKSMRKDLGFQDVGTSGLKKLYQYARLDADERRIQKEKQLLKEK